MMDDFLFDPSEFRGPSPGDVAAAAADSAPQDALTGHPRLRMPERQQMKMYFASLDEMLEAEHPVRAVWAAVCGLDLGRWLAEVKAVEGHVGRNATDPRLLVALWVYATVQGVGSARRLADYCKKHLAYRWLCGGVTVNHHLLSDFRSQGGAKWDDLMTQIVASLMSENLVTLQRVAQDGMRVRAHAGKASFRRRERLEQCLKEARQQVENLKSLADDAALSRQEQATRERAARERQERVEEAIRQCEELQRQRDERAKKSCQPAKEARASTTDPEARNMKFPDGGFQPGYNVQFSTDTSSGVIVGVDVVNEGSDAEQLPPMLDQLEQRYGDTPDEALVDGGFGTKEAINDAAARGCTVYAPLKEEGKQKAKGADPHAPKRGDSPAVAAWRERMGTEAAKTIYKLRCQTAEWVNAICRNRGLYQMPVRGLAKCRTVAVLFAVTHNLLQALKLRAQLGAIQG